MFKVVVIGNVVQKQSVVGSFIERMVETYRDIDEVGEVKHLYRKSKGIVGLIEYWVDIWNELGKDCDIVHFSYPTITALPQLLRRKRYKIIFRFHGGDWFWTSEYNLLQNLYHKMSRSVVLRFPDHVIFPSYKHFKRNTVKIHGKLHFFPTYGIKSEGFFSNKPNLPHRKRKYCVVGYAGRVTEQKGIFDLLEALRHVDYQFVIKLAADPSEAEKIKYSMPGNVDLSPVGFVTGKALGKFYRSLDIFVAPSKLKESFGNTVIEASLCGIPVISSNSVPSAEILNDLIPGIIQTYESGRGDELAKIITLQITSRQHENETATPVYEILENTFNHAAAISNYRRLLADE